MTVSTQQRLETRIGKVLSHQKARGGFSTALAYEPDDANEKQHGSLYFIIDIGSPSPLTADIAYNLIDIIKEEYYSDLELSAGESFENALKAANDELMAIAKQGEKDWIGKFNAVIAAVSGKEVHIVQRGTAEIHLLRSGALTNLSKGMYTPGETYRPEETLMNLVEGEIEVSDKLVVSTSELFYYVSIEKLKRLMDNHTPAQAAKKLATLLEQESEINHTSVLVAEFSLPELLAQAEEETEPSENWIGTPSEVQTHRRSGFLGGAPAIDKEKTVEQAIDTKEEEPEIPMVQETKESASDREELVIDEAEETEDGGSYKVRLPQLKISRPSLEGLKNGVNFGDYRDKLKIDSKQVNRAGKVAWQMLRVAGAAGLVAIDWVVRTVTKGVKVIKRHPKGNQILIGIVAGLVLIVVFSTIGLSRGAIGKVGGKTATVALAEAQQKRDEAQAALIYEDSAKARNLLAEAYLLAQSATSNRKTKDQATALVAELEGQLDTVNHVKRFNDIQPLADFNVLTSQLNTGSETTNQVKVGPITVLGGNVYAIDPDNNKVYKLKSTSSDVAIVNSLVSDNKKLKLVGQVSDKEIIFYTTPPNLYSLNLDNNSLTGKALDAGDWSNADQLIAYTNKLYFLDVANNQIWKYQTVPEGYTKVAPYFEGSAVSLAGATEFAIDGSVYMLFPNNMVKKYTGGSETQFQLEAVPSPYPGFGNITKIYTSADSKLYLVDSTNSRVLVYDKEGGYLAQYIYGNISNPSNLFVDEVGGFIYLTSGTAVYRLPMK
jgi:hypothetical protein